MNEVDVFVVRYWAWVAAVHGPMACRYHGTEFELAGMSNGRPRCELCRLPWALVNLRNALDTPPP